MAYCMDLGDQELWGNYESGIARVLQLRVVRCNGSPTCKTNKEIDQFIS